MAKKNLEYAKQFVRWTNCEPPLPPVEEGPHVVMDDGELKDPAITFYDWDNPPDVHTIAFAVAILEAQGKPRWLIPADSSWHDLLNMLGPDIRDIPTT